MKKKIKAEKKHDGISMVGAKLKPVNKKMHTFLAFLLGLIISWKVLPGVAHAIYILTIACLSIALYLK